MITNCDIEISDHAYDRIKERLRTRDDKIGNLVCKAWRSTEANSRKITKAEYKNGKYKCRFMMGYVFIFGRCPSGKILVTVY